MVTGRFCILMAPNPESDVAVAETLGLRRTDLPG